MDGLRQSRPILTALAVAGVVCVAPYGGARAQKGISQQHVHQLDVHIGQLENAIHQLTHRLNNAKQQRTKLIGLTNNNESHGNFSFGDNHQPLSFSLPQNNHPNILNSLEPNRSDGKPWYQQPEWYNNPVVNTLNFWMGVEAWGTLGVLGGIGSFVGLDALGVF